MENYPPNSRKAKDREEPLKRDLPQPKKVEKVITGEAIRRKKSLGKRFSETFVGGDARSVWGYVAFDVMIPAAKDMISDAVSQGVERMLFGEVRGRGVSRGRDIRPGGYTSYNRLSSGNSPLGRRDEPRRELSRRARAVHDFDEIILATKVEAEEVIDRLFSLISEYEVVTVADLYEAVGQSGNFTDEKWGWTDIRGAGATRVKGGYLLDLPRPEQLD